MTTGETRDRVGAIQRRTGEHGEILRCAQDDTAQSKFTLTLPSPDKGGGAAGKPAGEPSAWVRHMTAAKGRGSNRPAAQIER